MTTCGKIGIFKKRSHVACAAFTLVETILAVAVIGLVITSTAQLTQSSLRVSRTSTTQFAAYHIAEEGLEIVRAIRDSNWLQNSAWNVGLSDGSYFVVENSFPWKLQKITGDSSVPEIILYPEIVPSPISGAGHSNGLASLRLGLTEKFKRTVTIVSMLGPLGAEPVIRVKSAVQYKDRGEEREVELVMELTDWKRGPL